MTTPLRGDELSLPLWRMALAERDLELFRLRSLGFDLRTLARRSRLSTAGVLKAIVRVGYEKRGFKHLRFSRRRKREIARAYLRGLTVYDLADQHGVSPRSIRRLLTDLKTPMRPRGRRKSNV